MAKNWNNINDTWKYAYLNDQNSHVEDQEDQSNRFQLKSTHYPNRLFFIGITRNDGMIEFGSKRPFNVNTVLLHLKNKNYNDEDNIK